jgi:uncharacterized membrane protein YtjA (UPF0391 family)
LVVVVDIGLPALSNTHVLTEDDVRDAWPTRTLVSHKWKAAVSIVAGLLGFTGISVASADIARFLLYVFAVIFLVLLILGLTIFRV